MPGLFRTVSDLIGRVLRFEKHEASTAHIQEKDRFCFQTAPESPASVGQQDPVNTQNVSQDGTISGFVRATIGFVSRRLGHHSSEPADPDPSGPNTVSEAPTDFNITSQSIFRALSEANVPFRELGFFSKQMLLKPSVTPGEVRPGDPSAVRLYETMAPRPVVFYHERFYRNR